MSDRTSVNLDATTEAVQPKQRSPLRKTTATIIALISGGLLWYRNYETFERFRGRVASYLAQFGLSGADLIRWSLVADIALVAALIATAAAFGRSKRGAVAVVTLASLMLACTMVGFSVSLVVDKRMVVAYFYPTNLEDLQWSHGIAAARVAMLEVFPDGTAPEVVAVPVDRGFSARNVGPEVRRAVAGISVLPDVAPLSMALGTSAALKRLVVISAVPVGTDVTTRYDTIGSVDTSLEAQFELFSQTASRERLSTVLVLHDGSDVGRTWAGLFDRVATRLHILSFAIAGGGSPASFSRKVAELCDHAEAVVVVGPSRSGEILKALPRTFAKRIFVPTLLLRNGLPVPPKSVVASALSSAQANPPAALTSATGSSCPISVNSYLAGRLIADAVYVGYTSRQSAAREILRKEQRQVGTLNGAFFGFGADRQPTWKVLLTSPTL